jgi:hypothetical protein
MCRAALGVYAAGSPMLTHEIVGKTALDIDWLADQAVWG